MGRRSGEQRCSGERRRSDGNAIQEIAPRDGAIHAERLIRREVFFHDFPGVMCFGSTQQITVPEGYLPVHSNCIY